MTLWHSYHTVKTRAYTHIHIYTEVVSAGKVCHQPNALHKAQLVIASPYGLLQT